MCDFFWLSQADQGDLSDVVRASLQQLPAIATAPSAAACSHESLGAGHDMLLQGANSCGDHDHEEVQLQQQQQQQQQLGRGDGMRVMVSGGDGDFCDPFLLQSSPSCRQTEPLQMDGLIQHVMLSPPPTSQLLGGAGVVEGECHVAALEMDELGLDMTMDDDAHPHHAPAIKRRKNQTKKIVCIPAPTAAPPGVGGRPSTSGEVVPSDLWAWRKYGQKPIKGSPYPRGYYRCSSSKGCSARKQVERSRTDPSMLVITYTSDHNHPWPTQRNALAGSTRPATSSSTAAAKSHGYHRHSVNAAVPAPPPPPRHHTTNIVGHSVTPSSISDNAHHQQLPKQEVLDVVEHPMPEQDAAADHDFDMLAEMDVAINIMPASNFNSSQQQQHATAADDGDDHLEQDDKQQLWDPFSFSCFDWVGASFGAGEANKDGYT